LPVAVGVAVEFVGPLTEYLGTENGKGGHKKLFSEPNKSKINSLTRKEKTTAYNSGFAFTHPFGWTTYKHMIVPQSAEKLTATDIQDSSAQKHGASKERVRGSGFSKAPSNPNYKAGLKSGRRNKSCSESKELELYIQMRDKVLQEIIEHGLTTAQSKIFFYFYSLDRFGDRPIRAKVVDILRATKISKSVYYTALAKFKSLGWFRSPHPDVGISNYCTPKRKSEKQDYESEKQDYESEKQDSQSEKQDSQSEKQDSEKLKPLPAKVSKTPQTLQTYSDLLHTLSEDQRESFKKFCLKKIQECSFKIGSKQAWLNKHGAEYLEEFKETYSYALANPAVIPPKATTPFDIPDIPYLKRVYGNGWKDAAIHYGLIDPDSPEEEIQDGSEQVASSQETEKLITDSNNPQEPTPLTPAIGPKHRKFAKGNTVVIAEAGNIHKGETGKVIFTKFGSQEDEYRIALDRESHSVQEVTIKIPKPCRLTYLVARYSSSKH
jgi:hypothetical protein